VWFSFLTLECLEFLFENAIVNQIERYYSDFLLQTEVIYFYHWNSSPKKYAIQERNLFFFDEKALGGTRLYE